MRKALCLVLLFVLPSFAKNPPPSTAVPPACGADAVRFDTKPAKNQNPPAKPEAGKALVFFLQDNSLYRGFPCVQNLLCVDGQWIGATHANSYFYFSVEPGEPQLCTRWRSNVGGHENTANLEFEPLDSDEGQLLIRSLTRNSSYSKK